MMNWYVLKVRPLWEKRVHAALNERATEENALDSYVPVEMIKRRLHHGRLRDYARPLLPGYVFVMLTDEMLAEIHDIEGVQGLVMSSGHPAVVPFVFLMEVRSAELRGEFDYRGDGIGVKAKGPRRVQRRKSKARKTKPPVARLADYVLKAAA